MLLAAYVGRPHRRSRYGLQIGIASDASGRIVKEKTA
jgi:hypothetical protein